MNLPVVKNKFTVIVIILVTIILAELVWAGSVLLRSNTSPRGADNLSTTNSLGDLSQQTQKRAGGTITLSTSKDNLKVGESVKVEVNIDSAVPSDGTDIILNYDPNLLMVEASGSAKKPVQAGSVYHDYPINEVNEREGKLVVSGISNGASGIVAKGLFGTVEFRAKAAGNARISLDFTPGSTIDSNIIESKTSKDILTGVNNLTLTINR